MVARADPRDQGHSAASAPATTRVLSVVHEVGWTLTCGHVQGGDQKGHVLVVFNAVQFLVMTYPLDIRKETARRDSNLYALHATPRQLKPCVQCVVCPRGNSGYFLLKILVTVTEGLLKLIQLLLQWWSIS